MDQLEKKLNDTIEFIQDASGNLQNGQAADMDGFQEKVKEVCEVITTISPTEAETYIEQMDKLQEVLQLFEIDLRQKKADIEVEIQKLNKKQSATTAYEKAQNSD